MNADAPIVKLMHEMQPAPTRGAAAEQAEPHIQIVGHGSMTSAFPVTSFAVAAIGTAALALTEYMEERFDQRPEISVDRRLASFWFGTSLRPQGWQLPSVRDAVTGDYRTQDGWIRLHANAPHHRAAALSVLEGAQREQLAPAIARWRAIELEDAIVAAGGCAAAMRTQQEWAGHPQGIALKNEPLYDIASGSAGPRNTSPPRPGRPLAGIRVLDLTRVLAGPVASRFLAGYGAEVLRIDPPFWSEPGMVPEVTLGKRCAVLDLRVPAQLRRLQTLLAEADVILHGYRADALERMGLGAEVRQQLRPGIVDVSLDAYGWTGPWRNRRGFDSLVQMSTGIASTGMDFFKKDQPTPLPVQALDHATGYLAAAAVLYGLTRRLRTGQGCTARLSLARTAALLVARPARGESAPEPESADDSSPEIEMTDWGLARRLKPPCQIAGVPMRWDYPASKLGSREARWQEAG